ncbi:MAG: MbnP family protein [Brumimicrobium sp.]
MKTIYYILILGLFTLSSCKSDKPDPDPLPVAKKARVNLIPTYDGEVLEFNSTYTTQEGYTIEFTKINVIFTNLKHDNKELFTSAVYKYEDDKTLLWQGEGDYLEFPDMTANIGVSEEENHEDPSARPNEDPLNILNTDDMHWGWDPGYIFLMIEGKADTSVTQDGVDLVKFLYHVGKDELLKTISLQDLNWTEVTSDFHETDIYVDMYKVFDGETEDIDIKNEKSSHTMPNQISLSDKVITNFVNAITTEK